MHFDEVGRELVRGSDMSQVRFDEQAHRDSSVVKHPYDLLEPVFVSVDIESAFSSEFLPLFRDERNQIGFDRQRNLRHGLKDADTAIGISVKPKTVKATTEEVARLLKV